MAFNEGDFVEIEYSAWNASDSTLIATTDEAVAKKAEIYEKQGKYGPALVILGSPGVIKGLDRAIRTMSLNETKKFTFKPEEAFGDRNQELVRVIPMSDFKARDISPYPGMKLNLDDFTATVTSVSAGRVVVDANHPYAGREIIYEVKVVKELKNPEERVKALGSTYNAEPSKISLANGSVTLSYDSKVNKNADYFVGRASLIAAVFTYIKGVEKVDVNEEYSKPSDKHG
ncbi:MAG: peptidylprolyl isomerase [Candidatus Micrarchaeota archaeon]|nr:peptidylprolyl isomerase [Candidatus Micrarchaeota archaeon]